MGREPATSPRNRGARGGPALSHRASAGACEGLLDSWPLWALGKASYQHRGVEQILGETAIGQHVRELLEVVGAPAQVDDGVPTEPLEGLIAHQDQRVALGHQPRLVERLK